MRIDDGGVNDKRMGKFQGGKVGVQRVSDEYGTRVKNF